MSRRIKHWDSVRQFVSFISKLTSSRLFLVRNYELRYISLFVYMDADATYIFKEHIEVMDSNAHYSFSCSTECRI